MPEPVHFEAAVGLADSWSSNWLWGLPLIVLNVIAHCFGLFNVRERIVLPLSDVAQRKIPPNGLCLPNRSDGAGDYGVACLRS